MNLNEFSGLFKKSFYAYLKNPLIVIPSVILLLFFILFSDLSVNVNYSLQDSISLTGWAVFFSIVSLIVISFFLSGLIGMSFDLLKKKKDKLLFLKYSGKYWFRNFLIILTIVASFNIARYLAHNIAFFIGRAFNFDVNIALAVFFLLYLAGLIGGVIFLSYANFYLVFYDLSYFNCIKKSFNCVKNNYAETLSIIIIFFAVNELITRALPNIAVELINAFIIVPYLSLILALVVLEFEEKK